MLKNKKLLIAIIAIVLIWLLVLVTILFIVPNIRARKSNINAQIESEKNIENNFSKLFQNVQYDEKDDDLVKIVYEYENNIENRYDVNVHIPKINLETCASINDEILEIFGLKLLDIVKNNGEYTRYTVDYVYSVNDTIISLVIRATLKEGNNPQRAIIKTYNYDVGSSTVVSLMEILEDKGLNKEQVQKQIIDIIREKNANSEVLASQGYNIYVRDLKSEEYKIENIQNYFISEDGHIYIVFAYGNQNYTETTDIIKL